jgi:uncharacterized protein YjbI with pentapeptide repeats
MPELTTGIGANLIGSNLIQADLTGADLSKAFLIGANLAGALLARANLHVASGLAGAETWLSQTYSQNENRLAAYGDFSPANPKF